MAFRVVNVQLHANKSHKSVLHSCHNAFEKLVKVRFYELVESAPPAFVTIGLLLSSCP